MNYIETVFNISIMILILCIFIAINNTNLKNIITFNNNYIISCGFYCIVIYFAIFMYFKKENFDPLPNLIRVDFDKWYNNFIINTTDESHNTQKEQKKLNCDIINNLELKLEGNISINKELTKCDNYRKFLETYKEKVKISEEHKKKKQFILRTLINNKFYYLVMTQNKSNELPNYPTTKETPELCYTNNALTNFVIPMLISDTELAKNYKSINYHFNIIKKNNTYILSADTNNNETYILSANKGSPEAILTKNDNIINKKFLCGEQNIPLDNKYINFTIETTYKQIMPIDVNNPIFKDKNADIFTGQIDLVIKNKKNSSGNYYVASSNDLIDPKNEGRIPLCIIPNDYIECKREDKSCNIKTYPENKVNYSGTHKLSFEVISVYF